MYTKASFCEIIKGMYRADVITAKNYNEFDILPNKYIILQKGLKKITGNFTFTLSGDTQWQRESKILSLGIGNKKDYLNFISLFIDETKNTEILEFIISKLSKKDLRETINEINKYYTKQNNIN